jgi:hypothetical protein
LSSREGIPWLNVVKFGEPFSMATPSEACVVQERVETRRQLSSSDKGIVQTTNSLGSQKA